MHPASLVHGWRFGVLGLLFFTTAFAAPPEPELRISPREVREEVRAVVQAQLAALLAADFSTAYEMAASGIKRQFDERLFAAMIRRGYPALLKAGERELGFVRDDGAGTAEVTVAITDAQKRSTVYRYVLINEDEVWRVAAVVLVQRPPRGDI
jgi:hypothetical protein